jgi:dsRNA-specific ribonuclease
MSTNNGNGNWFEVDRQGLASLMDGRGKEFVLYELLQNALDEDTTAVHITLSPVPGRALCDLQVEDDSPEGFRDLAHAFTLFAQAPAVTVGWDPVEIHCGPRDKHYYALAVWPRSAGVDETTMAEATASTKKRAEQWAAVRMVARLLDLTPPEMPPEPAAPVMSVATPTGTLEDPVSALMTHSQRTREAAPAYTFTSSGPPHSPVITCQVVYRGITLAESAKSKQEAKKKASASMLAALG